MSVLRALLLVALFAYGLCHAHQDRIIAINAEGTLVGLPAEFAPARLHITFDVAADRRAPITSVELWLGKQNVRLPFCVTAVLMTDRLKDVKAYASWYHDEKTLPYYLNVEFHDPGYRASALYNSGFSLLFNLRTARLMEMKVNVRRDKGRSLQMLPLDIAALCPASERAQFMAAR